MGRIERLERTLMPMSGRPVLSSGQDAHMTLRLDEDVLVWLDSLSEHGDPSPWAAMVEGRDHSSGDSFIMSGTPGDRREDIYVSRDSGPAGSADLDLIAVARTYLPVLVAEVRRLRSIQD
jgi:hypothetical protein